MREWQQAGEGLWVLPPETELGHCGEVEASFCWSVESAPGRGLSGRGGFPTLAACAADAEAFDAEELAGIARAEIVEALSARGALEFAQAGEGEWAAPLAQGADYPRIAASVRYYPSYGPYPSGWRKAAGSPARTLAGAMAACEAMAGERGW